MASLSSIMKSPTLILFLACIFMVVLPHVSARRIPVGGNMGWSPNVNYTVWASKQHFYLGDWLFFGYDRNQMNVLEVNKTDYETCNSDHPLVNWTRGAGRDVVPLNQTKTYYFISGKGFCFGGMKLAAKVETPPPPPLAAPIKDKNAAVRYSYGPHLVLSIAFVVGAIWDSFLKVMW